MHWKKVTLLGVGLLGGSLGLALKKRGLAGRVTGFVRRKASLRECLKHGVVDEATMDLEAAVQGADLLVLCTPIARMLPLLQQALPVIQRGALITDVGSVKRIVVRELEPLAAKAGAHFVGSHPMAGGEQTGPSAAKADLFQDAICVITPTRRTSRSALPEVELLWKGVGCKTMRMTPERHDLLVSRTSHLPHVVAAGLATHVLGTGSSSEQEALCANGFRDTTRIAAGSQEMWRDIVMANRSNLTRELGRLIKDLSRFQRLLKGADAATIERYLARARKCRDKLPPTRKDS